MISSQAGSGGEGVRGKCASLDLLLVIASFQMPQRVQGVKTSSVVTMQPSLIRQPGIHFPSFSVWAAHSGRGNERKAFRGRSRLPTDDTEMPAKPSLIPREERRRPLRRPGVPLGPCCQHRAGAVSAPAWPRSLPFQPLLLSLSTPSLRLSLHFSLSCSL